MSERTLYETLSDEALVKLLFTEEDRLPRLAVDEFVARGERTIHPLTEIIEEPLNWMDSTAAWWAPIHATFILGAIGGIRAIPGLLKAIEMAEANDCDWVTSAIPSMFRPFGSAARPGLIAVATNPAHANFVRQDAIGGLAATTLKDPNGTEEIFALLGSIFADTSEDREMRGMGGNVLLDFQRSEFKESLIAFARQYPGKEENDFLEFMLFGEEDIVKAFAQEEPSIWMYQQDWLAFYDPDKIVERQARWAKEAEEEEEDKEMAYRQTTWEDMPLPNPAQTGDPVCRTTPKLGRNDPCPCGSGKKYKKCCLDREKPPASTTTLTV